MNLYIKILRLRLQPIKMLTLRSLTTYLRDVPDKYGQALLGRLTFIRGTRDFVGVKILKKCLCTDSFVVFNNNYTAT